MSQHQAICFMNGNIVEGPDGVSYDRQPVDMLQCGRVALA